METARGVVQIIAVDGDGEGDRDMWGLYPEGVTGVASIGMADETLSL